MIQRPVLLGLAVALCTTVSAQLTVAPQTNLQQLASTIAGPGVKISNPVINCHADGYGTFAYSGSTLGLDAGVLLTSGKITGAIGPNNVENTTFEQGTGGNSILNVVTGRSTRDACMFEFDIIPSGDSLRFNFVFASEEYNEWVGSQYNDVFGFFISGPGITGNLGIGNDRNIAVIPGTNQAVTINNVNNGSNRSHYYDNAGGQHIQYDGLTRGLYAEAAVQPCQTYHLKLIVADASDRKFDSGVFIERIRSNQVVMTSQTANGTADMVEGCNPGWVTFTRPVARPTPLNLSYYLQGTATNGTDYSAIGNVIPGAPKTITIPANQTSVNVNVNPIADGIAEPTEHLLFILGNPLCPAQNLDSLVFEINDTLIATLSPSVARICRGDSIQLHVTGGANYTWSPSSTLSSATSGHPWAKPTATTTYTVVVTDGTCSRTMSRQVRVSDIQLNAVITKPLCEGQANGAINLTVTGGIAPYTISWSGPGGFNSTTEDLLNRPAGTYTVTVADAAGCTRTQSFNVGSPAALSGTLTPSIQPFGENIACNGGSTGTLNLALTGGTAPYSINWTGPNGFASTNQNLSGLRAGMFNVSVNDANGCTFSSGFNMTEPTVIAPVIGSTTNVNCFGNNTGGATVEVSGGLLPYSYSWNSSPAQNTATVNGLAPGNYTVTVTDGYGCTKSVSTTITGPSAALSTSVSNSTHVSCFGGTNGAATVAASGGTGPYTFSWNTTPVQSTGAATDLPAGTWTCTVTDANGCSATLSITITQPAAALAASISAQANVNCFGANTGSATVTVSGGTVPYAYSWNTTPAQSGATASNLAAGTWTCTITDARGCTTTQSITITQPASALTTSISSQANVNCFGANTGSAAIGVTGGTAPYTYAWNTTPAQSSATATNLAAGTWTCTVTDANGCSTNRSITITQPTAALATSIGAQANVSCFGASTGSATVSASGGAAPYEYGWNTSPAQTGATASNLKAGTWTCTVTDANGCSTTRNITITQPASSLAASIGAQTNVNCFGGNTGSASVSASGGTGPYTFAWNTTPAQNNATANNLSVGTWTCTITDARGCTTTQSVAITQPAAVLSAGIDAQTNVSCFGSSTGSATVTVNGGTAPYSYGWNTTPAQNGATANNLPVGTWTCTISDARGCSTTQNVTITQPAAAPATSIGTQTNVNCFGGNTGSATIAVSGGSAPYTYSWNTTPVQTGATANNLPAGTWTCTVTDANGCTTSRNVIITQPAAALATNIDVQTNVNCFSASTGSATITANGGTAPYSYSWNTTPVQTGATANNLTAGTWTCTVTDARGCTTAQNVTITQPAAALNATSSAQTHVNCFGANTGSATLTTNGGTAPYSYSWNTTPVQTGSTAIALPAGTWTCTVADARECTTTRAVTITQPAAILATNISTQTHVNCFGANTGSATIGVSGGTAPYTYSWNTSPAQTGTTANNLPAGTWTCTVTDARGCTSAQGVTITQPAATLNASILTQTHVNCFSANTGSATIGVSGGTTPYVYSWNTTPAQTSATANSLAAGTWTCSVTDANGCSTIRSVTISQPTSALTASLSAQTNVSCFGSSTGNATIAATGGTTPYSYSWNTTPIQTSATANSLAAGTWTCTVTDARGCSTAQSVTITQPTNALSITLGVQTNVSCFGGNTGSATMEAVGGTAPYQYSWNTTPAQAGATASNLSAGTWTCTVTDANGCSTTRSATITQPAAALSLSGDVEPATCGGASNGSVDASINGGTAPYTVNWSGPNGFTSANTDISSLGSGVYVLSVTDNNGCNASSSFNVGQPGLFSISGTTSDHHGSAVSCPTTSDGSIDQTLIGGTAPYTHSWTGPDGFNATTEDLSGLTHGTYVYTLTDGNGCSTSATYALTAPAPLITSLTAPTVNGGWNIACNAAATGSIDATITGGVAPIGILWNGPGGFSSSDEDIHGLAAGTYTLNLTDANGCTSNTPIILTQAPALSGNATMTASVSCHGGTDGSAVAIVSGGTAPFTYAWSTVPSQNDPVASGLTAGIWTCTITDVNGCQIQRSVTIDGPTDALSVSITSTTDVLCHGADVGSAHAAASGGTAPYDYVWNSSPAQTSVNAVDLVAGTYAVTVTDARGCTATANAHIDQPASEIEILIDEVKHESCFGARDGGATIVVTGGSGSYTATWNTTPPMNGLTATGLAPGLYMVEVIDNNGCTHTKHHPVTIVGAAAPLTMSLDVDLVSCNGAGDGAIDLSLTGGHEPYSHIWTAPDAQQTGLEDIDGLDPGTYALHIIDFHGCALDTTITITEPNALGISGTITTAACQGSSTGAMDAYVSGGTMPYGFAWSGPNGFIANTEDIAALAAGVYGLTVTDANGCTLTENFNVSQPGSLEVTATLNTFNGGWGVPCSGSATGSIDLDVTGGTAPFSYDWTGPNGFNASTEDISGLASGTYTVAVSDQNGCPVTLSRTITAPAPLHASAVPSVFGAHHISCEGASDGSIDASITGGTAPFTFAWSGPGVFNATTEDIGALVAGNYTLLVTDANGCSTTTNTNLIGPEALGVSLSLSTQPSGDAISCHGDATGSIALNVTGGNQPYAIQWNGTGGFMANTIDINDLTADTYAVVVTDGNGCIANAQATLTEPTALDVIGVIGDHNGISISCNGAANGTIDLSVTGGAGNNTFIWSGPNGHGATNEDVSGLEPGNYTVTVTDQNGCAASASFILEEPDLLGGTISVSDFNGNALSCAGATDGAIDLTIEGGTAPFTIQWNGPNGFNAFSEDLSALTAGTYTATITDANGCMTDASATLTAPQPIDLDLQTSLHGSGHQISCAGGTDGSIDLSIRGGTAPYSIAWSDGSGFTADTEDINGLGAGLYQVTVTDTNGCMQQSSAMLTAPLPVDVAAVLSDINGSNVTCNGATDGSIDLSVSGGVMPYTILWNDGSSDEDRAGITSGTYSVSITDANGCVTSASYTLAAPASVLVEVTANITPSGMQITCAGGTDGSLDASISGGTLPYTIAWSGPNSFNASTGSITALAAGNYELVVTDANGCSHTSDHVVSEPAPVHIDLASVTYNGGYNIPCATIAIGVFNATTTGGTPGYTYAWTGPDGFSSDVEDLISLAAGRYDLLVTDANGCTGTAGTTLTSPDPMDVVIAFTDFDGSAVSCAGNDGGVVITVTGGAPAYQFDWTGPNGFGSQQEDLNGLVPGIYELIVTDANGCRNDTTLTLLSPDPIQAGFVNNTNICGDASIGSIDLSITGGGAPYDVQWTGPNGFTSTDEDLNGLVNGTYTVSISDGLGCSGTFTTSLTGPAPISSGTYVSFYGEYNLQCRGDNTGVFNLAPVGGTAPFGISINGPDGLFSSEAANTGLTAGAYTVSITDANGCSLDTTITLTQPATRIQAELTLSTYPSGTNVSCHGASDGAIDATITGGSGPYVASWRGPDDIEFANTEDIHDLPAGDYNYELVVTDANQCSFFTTVTLTQPDSALQTSSIITIYNGFGTSCNGASDGAIDLSIGGGNGGHTQSWTGPDGFASTAEDINGLASGTYTATVSDINGCVAVEVVEITAPLPIAPTLNTSTFPGGTHISCTNAQDGSIEIVLTGGAQPFTYAWTGPDGFSSTDAMINGLGAGTYCVMVTDANGCTAESCSTLDAPTALAATATAAPAACATGNGSIDLTLTGGSAPFQFNWDNGATSEDLLGLAPGIFQVLVTDANGCTVQASATVTGSPALEATATTSSNDCHGGMNGAVDLHVGSGTAPYTFAWSNGATTEDLADLASGTYSVRVTDTNGCSFNGSYTIQQPTAIAIDTLLSSHAQGHHVSAYGAQDGSITTAVSGGAEPYIFSWSNGARTESINGLPAGIYTLEVTDANGCTASLTVELTQPTDLDMPTAFSPNGDNDNERFIVRGIEGYPRNLFTVLNRWGNVVYERPNYKNEWAGENSQGGQLPNGTYFVILSINDGDRTLQGYVDLRR